jgi:hypothetical protein
VPFAPLLLQAAIEYHVSDYVFAEQPQPQAGESLLRLFCSERLGSDMSEVQMGVIVGVHAALDQPAEVTNWGFVRSLVHLVVCMLTKQAPSFSEGGGTVSASIGRDLGASRYRHGFTETVLECTLALLNRLVRRHLFRSAVKAMLVHYFDALWAALSEMVSAPQPAQGASAVEILPTSLACNALELLGWMAQLCMEPAGGCGSLLMLSQWCAQLESACLETQPLQVRVFCARAVLHANILSLSPAAAVTQEDGSHCDVLLTCWSIVLTLLQDDDSDVRLLARYAVGAPGGCWDAQTDECMDSGEEEFLCPHRRYRSSEPAMGAGVVRRSSAARSEPVQLAETQHRFFVGQERVLDKISVPLADALYGCLRYHCRVGAAADANARGCAATLGLWWERWIRFSGRHEAARRILRGTGLFSDAKVGTDQDGRIFTAEQLNNNIEIVGTVELWADVFARLSRRCSNSGSAADGLVLAELLVFVQDTVMPSVGRALSLLDSFLGAVVRAARSDAGSTVCLQHNVLAHDAELYAYVYGNLRLLQLLREALGGRAELLGALGDSALCLSADTCAQVADAGLYLHPSMRAMLATHNADGGAK